MATAREMATKGTSCGIASTGKASASARPRNAGVGGGAFMSSPIAKPLSSAATSFIRNATCSSAPAGKLSPFDIRRSPGASQSVALGRSEVWAQVISRPPPPPPA